MKEKRDFFLSRDRSAENEKDIINLIRLKLKICCLNSPLVFRSYGFFSVLPRLHIDSHKH